MENKKAYQTIAVGVVSVALFSHSIDHHGLMVADINMYHTLHEDYQQPLNMNVATYTTVTSSSTTTTTTTTTTTV